MQESGGGATFRQPAVCQAALVDLAALGLLEGLCAGQRPAVGRGNTRAKRRSQQQHRDDHQIRQWTFHFLNKFRPAFDQDFLDQVD